MEIITKSFNGTSVLFSNNESVYINASHVANSFQKQPAHWLRNKDTKEYIEAVAETYNLKYDKLVLVKKGNFSNGQTQGTWLHQKLIIAFARWLKPKFAVWCDLQIEEILKSKNSQPVQTSQNFDLDSYILENEKLIKLIKLVTSENAITLHYLDKLTQKLNLKSPVDLLEIDLNSYYFIPTELGKFFNKSAVEINKILEKKGFQEKIDGVWILTETGKDYAIQLYNNYKTIKWKLESLI